MKIKKTLIISSFVLALILVVTLVSVSAAWFGDTLSQSQNLNVNTANITGKIVIRTSSTVSSEKVLKPATMKAGALLNGSYTQAQLDKLDKTKANELFDSPATSAILYFPIYGVGSVDSTSGKLPTILSINGVYIPKDQDKDSANDMVNYLSDFNIKMSIVDNNNDYALITSTPVANLVSGDGKIYWNYSSNTLKVLMEQNKDYYVKLEVTFSKVDEELPPELLDTEIRVDVKIQSATREDIVG